MGSGIPALGAILLALWASGSVAECVPGRVELRATSGKVSSFNVEIADTETLRSVGLMQRENLPTSAGMLFTYAAPRRSVFWMKDTLIPLDILFFDQSGRLRVVKHSAQPMDLTPIDGGKDVAYVLEINGGLAKRLGLGRGAKMRSTVMDQTLLAWPCP